MSLAALEHDPELYGARLFDELFPPNSKLLASFRDTEASLRAQPPGHQSIEFRLNLSSSLGPGLFDLGWERLFDFVNQRALARVGDIAFSRFLSAAGYARRVVTLRPRLLVAVAAAPDLEAHGLAPLNRPDLDRELRSRVVRPLQGRWFCEVLQGPVTVQALQKRLRKGRFHALLLIAHGTPPGWPDSGLVLQSANTLAAVVSQTVVTDLLRGSPALRLAVLMSCSAGAVGADDPFQGLPGRLLLAGVPAVVAPRRPLSLEAALLFGEHFFSSLAAVGRADVAACEARRQLSLEATTRPHWSDPLLVTRLRETRPWVHLPVRWLLGVLLAVVFLATVLLGLAWISRPAAVVEVLSKLGIVISGTEPPGSTLQGQVAEAEAYIALGGENVEKGLRCYREIVGALPPGLESRLDANTRAEADRHFMEGNTDRAIELYRKLLAPLVGASSENPG